jgi:hypothetical protein
MSEEREFYYAEYDREYTMDKSNENDRRAGERAG